jgi:glyoxylase-like metal-dependent hydrolase (beta-lactamase superfamily II)
MSITKFSRRRLLKTALGTSVSLVGISALSPLYAIESMEFRGPDVPDVEAVKVGSRCYYVPALGPMPTHENYGFFNNPCFIITSKGVVVVDTGSSVQIGEMVLRQIRTITDKPIIKVINTHFHGDHWLGNHAFIVENPKVEIYAHPNNISALKGGADKFWFDFLQKETKNQITGTIMSPPDKILKGGEVIKLGDTTLKIYYFGQMHTNSDLAVEVVEDKTMIMGDMVMRRIANMSDGSFLGTIKGLDEVLKLPIDTFIPMHGKHEGKKLIEDGKQFMEIIYHDTVKYYDEDGLSDFEIKPKIMADSFMKEEASKWPGFDVAMGKFIVAAIKEHEESMF